MLLLRIICICAVCQSCTQKGLDNSPSVTQYFRHHAIDSKYSFGHISATHAGHIDGDGYLDIVIRSGKSGKAEIAGYKNPLGEK